MPSMRKRPYKPLGTQTRSPVPNPPGDRPVRGSAPVNPVGPLMLEVRAVGGAYVLDSYDREIPNVWVTVERTPHIMNAIRAGDLERRDKAGDPVAATKPPAPARGTPPHPEPSEPAKPESKPESKPEPEPEPEPTPDDPGYERWLSQLPVEERPRRVREKERARVEMELAIMSRRR